MKIRFDCPEIELLEQFAVGRISDSEARRIEEHLDDCLHCVAVLPSLGEGDGLMQALRALNNKPQPDRAILDDLRKHLLELQPITATAVFTETSSPGLAATPSPAGSQEIEEDARSLLAPAQQSDEIGRLGSYRVLRVLSTAGGMGIVYEGEDPQLKRRVALKAMRPALANSSYSRQRFQREAQRMASLTHDHILAVHHVGEEGAVPFLAMPLLKGESLEDRLQREGKLPVVEVFRIGREAALGLAAAHEKGVIHRDIKPANLWLEAPSGRVKILDFGLARQVELDPVLTGARVLVGTPSYMAPEQAEGEVEARADLFSLGCVLYRMVTGQLPFPGTTAVAALRAVATLNPTPAQQINRETPEALSQLIERLLSKDRAGRPASADAIVQELQKIERTIAVPKSANEAEPLTPRESRVEPHGECAVSFPVPPTPGGTTSSLSSPARRQRWFWYSAAGLFLAGGLAVAIFVDRRPSAMNSGASTNSNSPSDPAEILPDRDKPHVLGLDVEHYAYVNGIRAPRSQVLGRGSYVTYSDDSVEVKAQLSQPAYAFLIAFRPNGTERVCFPEKENEAPPWTDRLGYPSVSTDMDYALEEGPGLHAFAVVVSSKKLPPFKEWWSRQDCPWHKSKTPPGVVWRTFDDTPVEELTAAPPILRDPRPVQGKASVARLRDWLSKRPLIEAVAVLGFAVMPKDKR